MTTILNHEAAVGNCQYVTTYAARNFQLFTVKLSPILEFIGSEVEPLVVPLLGRIPSKSALIGIEGEISIPKDIVPTDLIWSEEGHLKYTLLPSNEVMRSLYNWLVQAMLYRQSDLLVVFGAATRF